MQQQSSNNSSLRELEREEGQSIEEDDDSNEKSDSNQQDNNQNQSNPKQDSNSQNQADSEDGEQRSQEIEQEQENQSDDKSKQSKIEQQVNHPDKIYQTRKKRTSFQLNKADTKNKQTQYLDVQKIIRKQKGGRRFQVVVRESQQASEWVLKTKIHPKLLEEFRIHRLEHWKNKPKTSKKISSQIKPQITTYICGYTQQQTIGDVLSHYFDLKGEIYYKVRLNNGDQKTLKREDVLLNNPSRLAVYYQSVYNKIQNI